MDDKRTRVSSFLGSWVAINVPPAGYKAEGDLDQARGLASTCVALAKAQDITRQDFEDEVGDLDEHMRRAQNIAQKTADAMHAPGDLRPA